MSRIVIIVGEKQDDVMRDRYTLQKGLHNKENAVFITFSSSFLVHIVSDDGDE